jgi:hypothetical protein
MSLRTLVFTLQPPRTVISGQTFGPLRVAALNAPDASASPVMGKIEISLDDCPDPNNGRASGVPKRLRAKAAGCTDALSDIFYVLQN